MSAALLALLAAQAPSIARTTSIPLPTGFRIEEALTCDLSGDDVADLGLALAGPGGRRLALHLRRETGPPFVAAPDAVLDLTPDVIAFAAADVLPDAGREVLLFNAAGVFAWRWREADESRRFARLADADLLWQLAGEGGVFHLQRGVADLDGDGREDLALPEPGGLRVLFQRPGADAPRFGPAQRLAFPDADLGTAGPGQGGVAVSTPRGKRRVELRVGGSGFDLGAESEERRPYLSVDEEAAAAQLVDFDADGDLDVLALTDAALHVWIQEPRGTFDPAHVLRLASPVPRDRSRELDVSFQARTVDLDGDRRADVVFFAQDQRADEPRTQALVFLQSAVAADAPPLFGEQGLPRQLLVLDGFARPLGLDDVDGDGRPDLVAAALRPDLIDALRAATSQRIEAELYVYRNLGPQGFSKRPDLTRTLSVLASAGARGDTFVAGFAGDLTGDGVRELFERTENDRLRAFLVRRGRDGALSVVDRPLWELAVAPEARVLFPGGIGPRTPDIFVLEPASVLCTTFR